MRRSFDLLAVPYRWLEFATFGPWLQRCRTLYLPQRCAVQNALVLGDGDGRFATRLLLTAPSASVVAVDNSPAMLAQLTQRCRSNGVEARLTTCVADLRVGMPGAVTGRHYDLVATHFFLDCLTELDIARLVQQVVPLLAPGAQWVVSEFNVPDTRLKIPARLLIRLLYLAFHLITGLETQRLPNYRAVFSASGLRLERSTSLLGGLLVAERWVVDPRWSRSAVK